MEFSSNESDRKLLKPNPSIEKVGQTIIQYWNVDLKQDAIKKLESYDDANFYCELSSGEPFLVKFYNGADSIAANIICGYAHMLRHINNYFSSGGAGSTNLTVPRVFPAINGGDIVFIDDCEVVSGATSRVGVCMCHWITGSTLNRVGYCPRSLAGVGIAVGHLTRSLSDYDNPVFHRFHIWDLPQFTHSQEFVQYVEESHLQEIIARVYLSFTETVVPVSNQFTKSIVMGDCNDANIIAADDGSTIKGIIDFGDATFSWSVNDIAVAIAYSILSPFGLKNLTKCIACMLGGYLSVLPLKEIEIASLRTLIATRLCISISIGSYSIFQNPANREYLSMHSSPAKAALQSLWGISNEQFVDFCHRIQHLIRDREINVSPDRIVELCENILI